MQRVVTIVKRVQILIGGCRRCALADETARRQSDEQTKSRKEGDDPRRQFENAVKATMNNAFEQCHEGPNDDAGDRSKHDNLVRASGQSAKLGATMHGYPRCGLHDGLTRVSRPRCGPLCIGQQ